MKGSDFRFHSVQFLYYKCRKVNFRRDGSNIESLDQIKEKKATINPKYEDDKCFQYVVIVALNSEKIESHSEGVSNIKPFINKYIWKGINYPSKIDDCKNREK